MKVMRGKQKGFTLIEVLIVVVIIGVLAALIVPRMMAAPEKAIVAEANQMLGTIIRAQQANADSGGAWVVIADNTTAATWNRLGLQPPGAAAATAGSPKFNYTCAASPTCQAARLGNAANATISLTTATPGVWNCNAGGGTAVYTAMANGGCSA